MDDLRAAIAAFPHDERALWACRESAEEPPVPAAADSLSRRQKYVIASNSA
jgi:hypothetical protein